MNACRRGGACGKYEILNLIMTPQTEVHTKNRRARYHGSGPIELTCTDRQD